MLSRPGASGVPSGRHRRTTPGVHVRECVPRADGGHNFRHTCLPRRAQKISAADRDCLKLHLKLEVSVIKEPQRGAYINGY